MSCRLLFRQLGTFASQISVSLHQRPAWLQHIFHDKRTFFEDVEIDAGIGNFFLKHVNVDSGRRHFKLAFTNGKTIETSFVALREACQCPECFFPVAQQRKLHLLQRNIAQIKPNGKAVDGVRFCDKEQMLHVKWENDEHVSCYSGPWLYATFKARHPLFEPVTKKPWRVADLPGGAPPTHEFANIIDEKNQKFLLSALNDLATTGLVKITNAPAEAGLLRKVFPKLFNYIRATHLGLIDHIEVKPMTTNIGYQSGGVPQHTDLAYYEHQPNIQIFHCVRQSDVGGESSFADSLAVAAALQTRDPKAFKILSTIPIHHYIYHSEGRGGLISQKGPILRLNESGHVEKVVLSNQTLDVLRGMGANDQVEYYTALQNFMKLLDSNEFKVNTKLKPGDIVLFDNFRVTHGRQAFTKNAPRLIESCYFDWDSINARIRQIRSDLCRQRLDQWWVTQQNNNNPNR